MDGRRGLFVKGGSVNPKSLLSRLLAGDDASRRHDGDNVRYNLASLARYARAAWTVGNCRKRRIGSRSL
jgi:hypothetical protein